MNQNNQTRGLIIFMTSQFSSDQQSQAQLNPDLLQTNICTNQDLTNIKITHPNTAQPWLTQIDSWKEHLHHDDFPSIVLIQTIAFKTNRTSHHDKISICLDYCNLPNHQNECISSTEFNQHQPPHELLLQGEGFKVI
jgi:hypothetical protein